MKTDLVMSFWNLIFANWILFISASKFRVTYINVVPIAYRYLFLYFFDNYTPVSAYTVFVSRYAVPPTNVRSRFYQYNAITPSYDRWNSFDKWCDLQCMHLKLASRFVSNSLGCSLTHSLTHSLIRFSSSQSPPACLRSFDVLKPYVHSFLCIFHSFITGVHRIRIADVIFHKFPHRTITLLRLNERMYEVLGDKWCLHVPLAVYTSTQSKALWNLLTYYVP